MFSRGDKSSSKSESPAPRDEAEWARFRARLDGARESGAAPWFEWRPALASSAVALAIGALWIGAQPQPGDDWARDVLLPPELVGLSAGDEALYDEAETLAALARLLEGPGR